MPIMAILRGRYLAIWAVFDEKSKVAPNRPEMMSDVGGVFRPFSAYFRPFLGPVYSVNRLLWLF